MLEIVLLCIILGVDLFLYSNLEKRVDKLERGEFKDYEKGKDGYFE